MVRIDHDVGTRNLPAIDKFVTVQKSALKSKLARQLVEEQMQHTCYDACLSKEHNCKRGTSDCATQAERRELQRKQCRMLGAAGRLCRKRYPRPLRRRTMLNPATGYIEYKSLDPEDAWVVEVNELILVLWMGHANCKIVSDAQILGSRLLRNAT